MALYSVCYNFGYLGIKCFRHDIVIGELVCGYQTGNGFGSGQFHLFGDLGSTTFQSTLEDTGESDHIVHLIGKITASGSYDTGTGSLGYIRHDLGHGIGHGEQDGIAVHGSYHLGSDYVRSGNSDEDIGTFQSIGQRAGLVV